MKTSDFCAKTSCYSSRIQNNYSKFEFQASFCITNLKYYICEASAGYGHRGGFHGRENSEKQRKTVILAPKLAVTAQKFKFFNSKFEFQASFCIINFKHYVYEVSAEYGRRGDFHRRENSEKQRKTVILAPKLAVTAQNSNFEFKVWISSLYSHY